MFIGVIPDFRSEQNASLNDMDDDDEPPDEDEPAEDDRSDSDPPEIIESTTGTASKTSTIGITNFHGTAPPERD